MQEHYVSQKFHEMACQSGASSLKMIFELRPEDLICLAIRPAIFLLIQSSRQLVYHDPITLNSKAQVVRLFFPDVHVLVAQGCAITLTALYQGRQKSHLQPS